MEPNNINENLFNKIKIYEKMITISVIFLSLSVAVSVYFYTKTQIKSSNYSINDAGTSKIIKELGEIVVLPSGEDPTIATISDIEKVNDQPFFVNAQNGDKVLIYSKAKKAYLYRPSDKKLVEVAPLAD